MNSLIAIKRIPFFIYFQSPDDNRGEKNNRYILHTIRRIVNYSARTRVRFYCYLIKHRDINFALIAIVLRTTLAKMRLYTRIVNDKKRIYFWTMKDLIVRETIIYNENKCHTVFARKVDARFACSACAKKVCGAKVKLKITRRRA